MDEEKKELKPEGDFPVNKVQVSTPTPAISSKPNAKAATTNRVSSNPIQIPGSSKNNNTNTSAVKLLFFRMLDVIVSVTILLTISIGFWRGIWQISDYYCDKYEIDPWLLYGVCNVVLFLFYFGQETLRRTIHPNKMNFGVFYILTRILLVIHATVFVNQWRGLWVALDLLFPLEQKIYSHSLLFIIPINIAIILKIFSNFLATPLYVGIDDAHTIHSCPLRFNTPPEKTFSYLWDCFFSVVIVQTLTIASWCGLWGLADIGIYPDDMLTSAIVSWVIGNSIVILLCAIQPIYYKTVIKMKGLSRLALMNFVTLIGFIGCVLSWRGCWELFNELLIFPTKLTSEWVSTIFGVLGAVLLGCLSTVVNRGAMTDGELSADDSSEWTVSYVSLLEQRDFTVPFPEPWILRYFCTSQKMNTKKRRRSHRGRSVNNVHLNDGEAMKPLHEGSSRKPMSHSNVEIC